MRSEARDRQAQNSHRNINVDIYHIYSSDSSDSSSHRDGERFPRQGRYRPPERRPGKRLDCTEEHPAPRQKVVSKQRFQRFAFIFRSMIYKPRGRQQQWPNVVGLTFSGRDPVFAEETANFSFARPFNPRATIRRYAALLTDTQRIVIGGHRLH
jgi:hypothetical protein